MAVGLEQLLDTSSFHGHSSVDLQQIDEHGQCLRHFMEKWFTQHDQILQVITSAAQSQGEGASQMIHVDAVSTPGFAIIDKDGSPWPVKHDCLQVSDQPENGTTQTRDEATSQIIQTAIVWTPGSARIGSQPVQRDGLQIRNQSDNSIHMRSQSDNTRIRNQCDNSIQMHNQSNSNIDVRNQSDNSMRMSNQSDNSIQMRSQSNSTLQMRNQSDNSIRTRNQSDNSIQMRNQSNYSIGVGSSTTNNTSSTNQTSNTNCSDVLVSFRKNTVVLQNLAAAYRSNSSLPGADLLKAPLAFCTQALVSETAVNPRMVKFVSSPCFEYICQACIITNAVVIAHASDYAARNLDNPRSPMLSGLEMGFAAFYIIEFTLRLMAYRLYFYFEPDWKWNVFDSILVVSAVYDLIIEQTAVGHDRRGSVVFLRVVRLMKMLRLLRMVRIMRMFRELRLIVCLIKGSLKALGWAILLIAIITYIVGICFLQAGTSYLQDDAASREETIAIQEHWGSVWRSMLSLYMAGTNGDAWKDMARALIPMGHGYHVLFLLYIAFFMFVVMNTLTSLFLEAAIQNADKDKSFVICEELRRKNQYMARAVELFGKIDEDGSGDITEEEFVKHAEDPAMLALAASLELEVSDIAQFYSMLSCRGRFPVDVDTFVVGCMKLKGNARSMDLQALIASEKRSSRTLETLVAASGRIVALVQQLLPLVHGADMPSQSTARSAHDVSCPCPAAEGPAISI